MASRRAVGIDIDSHSVKLVELVKTGSHVELADFCVREIGDAPQESVAEIFRNKRLTGREVVVSSLPASSVILREITFPFSDARKISRVIRSEAGPHLPFSADEAPIGFYYIDRQPCRVMMCAADSKAVQTHLRLFEKAPVKPAILLPDCFALFSLASYAGMRDGLVVHLSETIASICVIRNGCLSSARSLQDAAQLGREVEFTLNSLAILGKDIPGEILMLGEGKKLSDILREVCGKFDIKLREGRLPSQITHHLQEEKIGEVMQSASVLVGLGLVGLGLVEGMDNVNLLRAKEGSPPPLKKALVTLMVTCLIIILTGACGVFFELRAGKCRLLALEREAVRVFRQVFPGASSHRTILEMRGMLRDKAGISGMKRTPLSISPLKALYEVSAHIPQEVSVEIMDFSLNSDSLTIRGQTDSSGNVDIIRQALESSPYFKTVKIRDAAADSVHNKIKFIIEAAL